MPNLFILTSITLFSSIAIAQSASPFQATEAESGDLPSSQSQSTSESESNAISGSRPGVEGAAETKDDQGFGQPVYASDSQSYKRPSPTTEKEWQERYGSSESSPNDYHREGNNSYPPSEQDPEADFDMPSFSVRFDPFNWLLEGRLGIELEVAIWKLFSLELVPIFVVNDTPPSLNLSGREDNLSQASNGLGPISGTSIGLGIWLQGKPFKGYVLRLLFTNYGYIYKTTDDGEQIDRVEFTERRLLGFFGSHMNFGPFTIAAGIGLGVELNSQQRCFPDDDLDSPARSGCDDEDEQHIALGEDEQGRLSYTNLNGWAHPVYLAGRISLGFFFDFD